jgi:RNA polymerase sigma-70 factor, ECF subfamily
MSEARGRALELGGFEIGLQQAPAGTDNDLVREFIGGNDAAFTQLVTKYKDGLTNYLNVMVGDYEIAVDLSQETFLRVYKNIGKYSHIYQFSTWLYRIATNLAIDEMRYRKRRGQVFYRNVGAALGTKCCGRKAAR